jgi:hypothetical protein
MSKVEIKISSEVLNALTPQRRFLNAKAEELINQTFSLHSIVPPNGAVVKDLTKNNDDTTRVGIKFINDNTKQALTIPVRNLLMLQVAQISGKNAKYEAASTPVNRVHEVLLEAMTAGNGTANLNAIEKFTVVDVQNRMVPGTDTLMYPTYAYEAFQAKAKELREVDKDADMAVIYNDRDFMQGLYGTELAAQYENIEPTKEVVISIN